MELTRENISLYCQIGTMLDGICEKYFDNVADGEWQFYSDWGVYDDETIRLYYFYYDYNEYLGEETTEGGHIDVKIDDLFEFSKKLKKHVEYEDDKILNIQNDMLGVGKNVYIVLDNKLKFDAHNVMEHWYAQDDIIIRCPIIGAIYMEDGIKLYIIKINGDIYHIPCFDSYSETKKSNDLKYINHTSEGTTVVKLGKLEVNPNGDYQEILTNTDYFAFYNYKDAVKRFRWLFKFRFMKIKDELDNLIKNMNMAIDYLDDDISVDTDEYNEAVKKSYGDKYGYTEG